MPEFEWEDAKSLRDERQRGFDFEYASRIFRGSRIEEQDRRRDYSEQRTITTGLVDGNYLTVVYTRRAGRLRIISARRANRRERDAHRAAYP